LRGRFADARHHGQHALDLARRLGHRAYQASTLVNLALAENLAGEPQQAIQYAQEARAVFERCQEGWGISVAAQNLAEAYLALGDLDQAEYFAEWSVHQEETVTLPDSVRTLGEIAFARGQFQRAEQNIRQSLDIAVENQDPLLEAWAWRALGRAYQSQPEHTAADAAFARAMALFHRIDLPHQVATTRSWMTAPA
jgi:tetratricopeptide (TPR) repeat protein